MSATTVPMLLRFLAENLGWLAQRPEGEEAFDELDQMLPLMLAVIDTPEPSAYVGPCDVCGRDMYARPGAAEVKCVLCDLVYPVAERRAWLLDQVADQILRAAAISHSVASLGIEVSPERIRSWAQKGRLEVRGHDARGRALYRVGDVSKLAKEPRRKMNAGLAQDRRIEI